MIKLSIVGQAKADLPDKIIDLLNSWKTKYFYSDWCGNVLGNIQKIFSLNRPTGPIHSLSYEIFLSLFVEHFLPLFVDTFCGHSLKTLFVDPFSRHFCTLERFSVSRMQDILGIEPDFYLIINSLGYRQLQATLLPFIVKMWKS